MSAPKVGPSKRVVTPPQADRLIVKFLSKCVKMTTEKAYRQDLNAHARFAGEGIPAVALARLLSMDQESAIDHIEAYKKALAGKPELTFRRRISTVRAICASAEAADLIPWKLDVNLRVKRSKAQAKRAKKKDMSGPPEETVHLLRRRLADSGQPKDLRDLALVNLFHFRGLRVGEAVGMDVADVSFKNKTVSVLAKGADIPEDLKVRDVVLDSIRRWLAVRPGPKNGPLFVGLSRRMGRLPIRLSEVDVLQMLKARGRWIGYDGVLRPHGLRHTAITTAVNHGLPAGMDIKDVQAFARHKNINTTVGYVNKKATRVNGVMDAMPTS